MNVPRRNRTSIKPLGGARNIRYTRGTDKWHLAI